MCTIAILIEAIPGVAIALAANRDELYQRPTRGPGILRDRPLVVGGRDEQSGGSWLAVRADGHFAAVTNQRAYAPPPPAVRSRGLAVVELAAADDPDRLVDSLDPADYASMNLVWRSGAAVRVAYFRHAERSRHIITLTPGMFVLCNDALGSPAFPRADRLMAALARAAGPTTTWDQAVPAIERALADHTHFDSGLAPHLPPPLARALTATCIHSERYGTRSATLLALAADRVLDYRHADGPPCTAPFASHMRWFADA